MNANKLNLDLPVLNRSRLRKVFCYFLSFNVVITLTSIFLRGLILDAVPKAALVNTNSWYLIAAIWGLAMLITRMNKKELSKLFTLSLNEQLIRYETYYTRKLMLNALSIVLTSILFLLSGKNIFFYLLFIHIALAFVFYPSKTIITKELNSSDIIFSN